MKKKLFSALLILVATGTTFFMTGCSQDNQPKGETITNLPEDLSSKYVAPNGEVLFANDEAFINSTKIVLGDIYGEDVDQCTVNDITFFPVAEGYVATIDYVAPNGRKSNYVMTNTTFQFEDGELLLKDGELQMRTKSSSVPVKVQSFAIVPKESDKVNIKVDEDVLIFSCGGDALMKYNIK